MSQSLVQAVVFDLDGTLVDNMALHQRAFDRFNERHGLPPITEALRRRLDGQRNRDIFPILFDRALDEDTLHAHAREKESAYRELSRGALRPLAGLTAFLDRLARRDVPVAIATSAPQENVEHSLRELQLRDRFDVVVRSDEVPHGKPAPDVFLAAASRLGVAPACCLAFEDALPGVLAAHGAEMIAVAITTTFPAATFEEQGLARHAVADFEDFAERFEGLYFP